MQKNSESILKSSAKENVLENLSKNAQVLEENDEMKLYIGLVVEADNLGLIIWNRTHDLVRAPSMPIIGLKKRVSLFL